ncbi:MAG: signal peptidase II [Alphaproteobacteria bacterium]|nr:signal peptidase II [Alphaproteobacteria bacterium]
MPSYSSLVVRHTHLFCALLCIFVVAFDQATKWSVLFFLSKSEAVPVSPSLNLVLTFNYGTSFGLLAPHAEWQRCLLIGLTIGAIVFLTYAFARFRSITEKVLCSLVLGGAIGNLIDRFFHGAVVDFIDVYYRGWHWPAFNFADACISCSIIGLLSYNLFSKTCR